MLGAREREGRNDHTYMSMCLSGGSHLHLGHNDGAKEENRGDKSPAPNTHHCEQLLAG